MRRLAIQKRDDAYSSLKDYQNIITKNSLRLYSERNWSIFFESKYFIEAGSLIAWGGYFKSTEQTKANIKIWQNNTIIYSKEINLENTWFRYGDLTKATENSNYKISISSFGFTPIDVWGFSSGAPKIPGRNLLSIDDLDHPHLIPETYYLNHNDPINLKILSYSIDPSFLEGSLINLKKCSYCGRLLPLDPNRLGSLSFHKHNAKISNHQNECRACKKWRINDSFNPIRTPDQLHESSVITRERKILLREPEIIKKIKKRDGEGLRSQIWKKFDKKCFKCGANVALDNFQLDHTRPLAYLWPIDIHATCLCAKCNNEKKEKFPVDFYSHDELIRLSQLTGLNIDLLKEKKVNLEELDRIIDNLSIFAKTWDVRTFFAINRKIKEMHPNIDFMEILKNQDKEIYQQLIAKQNSRENINKGSSSALDFLDDI